jgi:hypothetical protein
VKIPAPAGSPKRSTDERYCGVWIALYERGFDAKNVYAIEPNERPSARGVSLANTLHVMHAAIDLDDEPIRRNVEVDDERIEDVLAANANAKLLLADMPPKQCLAARRRAAHFASEGMDREERRVVVFVHAPRSESS